MLVKVAENAIPVKKTPYNKPKHFVILCHSFSLNNSEWLKNHQLQ